MIKVRKVVKSPLAINALSGAQRGSFLVTTGSGRRC